MLPPYSASPCLWWSLQLFHPLSSTCPLSIGRLSRFRCDATFCQLLSIYSIWVPFHKGLSVEIIDRSLWIVCKTSRPSFVLTQNPLSPTSAHSSFRPCRKPLTPPPSNPPLTILQLSADCLGAATGSRRGACGQVHQVRHKNGVQTLGNVVSL